MKYGIYKLRFSDITSHIYSNLNNHAEAVSLGYEKVAESRTAKKASEITRKLGTWLNKSCESQQSA